MNNFGMILLIAVSIVVMWYTAMYLMDWGRGRISPAYSKLRLVFLAYLPMAVVLLVFAEVKPGSIIPGYIAGGYTGMALIATLAALVWDCKHRTQRPIRSKTFTWIMLAAWAALVWLWIACLT